MICKRCGAESENGAHICPKCGAELIAQASGKSGISEMRQGRSHEPPPVYGEASARPPRGSRAAQEAARVGGQRGAQAVGSRSRRREPDPPGARRNTGRRGVNTALLITILIILMLVAAVVLFVLAIRLPQGHLILLRATQEDESKQERVISMIGEEAAAEALWQIGQEQIDQGYISRCIETYNKAWELNPKIDGLYNRLLSLADAYEAVGQLEDAERVYRQLYTEVDEYNPLAYRYVIAMMLDQGRLFEATDLMQIAYDKTGELSFKSQREQRVPLAPTCDPESGRYMKQCLVSLKSPQGYDVYYLLNDEESELPEQGILYTDPILLGEGTHDIRAVCVSSELISDESRLRFTVWFPTPSAPKSRLLTGVYDKPRRVYLYMEDIKITGDTPNQQYTIYYTIDGTTPNIDSPVYDDEGFMLPVGSTTLRAVAVNQYGKVSNEYVGTYKVKGNIIPVYQDGKDEFKAFSLGKTTYEGFKKQFGVGAEQIIDDSSTASGKALQVSYEWGSARFTETTQTMFAISTSNAAMTGPRGSKAGMKGTDVMALFRDLGQKANSKGNRSLYFNETYGYGKYWLDSETTAHIEYVGLRDDDGETHLIYWLDHDTVTRIDMTLTGVHLD